MALEFISTLLQTYPRTGIILISIIISLFVSIVNYFVLDKEKMKASKDRQKQIQEEMKTHKDNPAKLSELQKEMFSNMGSSLKHSMKPMIFTFLPLIIVFPLVSGTMAKVDPAVWGILKSWFWWYLIASFASSMIFRKLFKLP